MSNKRDRGSPTGQTPRQPQKKKASSRLHLHPSKPISKKQLAFGPCTSASARSHSSKWTSEEERCLVKYLFMSGFVNTWPTTKANDLWESAACAMKQEGFERTGGSCRVRALIRLAYVFGSPVMALEKLIPKPIEQGKSYSPIPIEYCTPSLSPVAITRHDVSSRDSSPLTYSCVSPTIAQFSSSESLVMTIDVLEIIGDFNYVIPSFSVVTVKLKQVLASVDSRRCHIFMNANEAPLKTPISIVPQESCFVEVKEFTKSVDIPEMISLDDGVLVVWKWRIYPQPCDDEEHSDSGSDVHVSTNEDDEPEGHSSCPESDTIVRTTATHHTVTFKVIGCTKQRDYQTVLQGAKSILESGDSVPVELSPEPHNPIDPLAIAFTCHINGTKKRIGYVVKEAQPFVHDALRTNAIIKTEFKWIKYITDWYRSGPGFFAGVNVTKNGVWSRAVIRVQSTR